MAPDPTPVTEPFPISCIADRYLLFDPDTIIYARRNYNICGVLIGTIPNFSQQNVYLGTPLELTPEEARVLVERGHAYVVDDVGEHRKGFMEMSRDDRLRFLKEMDSRGLDLSKEGVKKAEERSEQALKEKGLARKAKRSDESANSTTGSVTDENEASLFDSVSSTPTTVTIPEKKLEPTFITPATSYPPLSTPPTASGLPLPNVPKSYPLFRYLHSRGYFMMPGLRFGCNYSVYPGDPLRFHSHFLATGLGWDEEFDLLDVVGGGRLGTGVKKAYLIGGAEEDAKSTSGDAASAKAEPVRAFSIEWAGL